MKQTHIYNSRPALPQHQQRGFTLVEIMVAISIGLLMMAGILQISEASKESSRLQRNMGFVQENIRTAMEMLGRDIRQAGYYEDNNPSDRILSALAPIVTATTSDGGGALNDVITVTYESDTDCLGQNTFDPNIPEEVVNNHFAVNQYFISSQRLMCLGNGNISAQPLVEGVESMQILYGENTDGDPRSANRYVRPEQANMNNIVSVRIALRFLSREHVRQGVNNDVYALLDAAPFDPVATDRRMRREITTTISLRN